MTIASTITVNTDLMYVMAYNDLNGTYRDRSAKPGHFVVRYIKASLKALIIETRDARQTTSQNVEGAQVTSRSPNDSKEKRSPS